MSADSLGSIVECPVCFEVPRVAHVYICINGHSICGSCKENVNICPQGRCPYANPPTRNRMVEHILEAGYYEVICQNNKEGCTYEGPKKDMGKHEEECMFRSVECPLDCHMEIRAMDLFDHMESSCPARTVQVQPPSQKHLLHMMECKFDGCKKRARASEIREHEEWCSFRLISCSHNDCPHMTTASHINEHETECPFRIVSCPNAPLCDVNAPFAHMQRHLQSECLAVVIECGQCGAKKRRGEIDQHMSVICPSRKVTCKHDYCSHRARVCDITEHELDCSFRMVQCLNPGCRTRTRALTLLQHLDYCPFRPVPCNHEGCQVRVSWSKISEHLDRCPFRVVKCRHRACRTEARANEIGRHEERCKFRLVKCKYARCPKWQSAREIKKHEGRCRYQLELCRHFVFGCRTWLKAEEIVLHEEFCIYHLVRCGNEGCDKYGWIGTWRAHAEKCPFRVVQCMFRGDGCEEKALAKEIEEHESVCWFGWRSFTPILGSAVVMALATIVGVLGLVWSAFGYLWHLIM